MSKGFYFEPNDAGMKALLKSSGVQSALISHANAVKDRAGHGYDVYVGESRANVSVRTTSESSARDNLRNNTLLKAVGSFFRRGR